MSCEMEICLVSLGRISKSWIDEMINEAEKINPNSSTFMKTKTLQQILKI